MSYTERPIEILLVEDNEGDILLMQEAFKTCKIINNINVVTDGEMALAYLYKERQHAQKIRPDLILLDINLPKKDGKQVLKEIKEDAGLCTIPVVMMTSSTSEQDVLKSYKLHANSYVTKPADLDQLVQIVNAIESFWFTVVALPDEVSVRNDGE